MWTRRDQLEAYQYLRRRLVYSLVVGTPNHPERLYKRPIVALISGGVVTALVLGALWVIGVLRPGRSDTWRDGRSVIVERESGARYVLGADGALHPVLNYASALLFLGEQRAPVSLVSQKSLRGAPRGAPLGIPGAPDALPDAKALLDGPWTVCSQSRLDLADRASPQVAVQFGMRAQGVAPPPGSGLLVRAAGSTDELSLVVDGQRYALASAGVRRALGFEASPPIPVRPGWLSTIPAGPPLDYVQLDDAGLPGPRVAGRDTDAGEVVQVALAGRDPRFYVVRSDGLQPVSSLVAGLLIADPGGPAGSRAGERVDGVPQLPAAEVDAAQRSTRSPLGAAWPADVPAPVKVAGRNVSVCAAISTTPTSDPRAELRILPSTPFPPGTRPVPLQDSGATPGQLDGGDPAAVPQNLVAVPPGRGALVQEATPDGQPVGQVSIVTDQGVRFPIADAASLAALGYQGVATRPTPREVLDLLPAGPTLFRPEKNARDA